MKGGLERDEWGHPVVISRSFIGSVSSSPRLLVGLRSERSVYFQFMEVILSERGTVPMSIL